MPSCFAAYRGWPVLPYGVVSNNIPRSPSVRLQKKHLESDDRLIAETHYHLGVAHSLANQYSEAIAAFQASVDTILARVQRLQRQILDREQGEREADGPVRRTGGACCCQDLEMPIANFLDVEMSVIAEKTVAISEMVWFVLS